MANYIQEFDSIQKFYQYLCDTPFNKVFRWRDVICSVENDYEFTQTHNFDEATNLLRNGWDDMSKTLTKKLNTECKNIQPIKTQKNVLSVSGYQPVVALYLAGIPQNMVDKQMVIKKQKVIELTKSINYSAICTKERIVEESIKSMMIVKKLEAQGFRVKLNLVLGTNADYRNVICKVCIKQPNERLNVSKLAFPMVHPSMLRRLFFRYIEVNPEVTEGYRKGYGKPLHVRELKRIFPNEIILPAIFDGNMEGINSLEELRAVL